MSHTTVRPNPGIRDNPLRNGARTFLPVFALILLFTIMFAGACPAQSASHPPISSQESAILAELAANPVTAFWAIQTSRVGSKIVLKGIVGTKQIHDTAIRLAIEVTPSIDDQLIIDTAALPNLPVTGQVDLGIVASQAMNRYVGPGPLIYPPPLFGRFDDPFLGFEPPLLTFPPWWTDSAETAGGIAGVDPLSNLSRPRTNLSSDTVEMTIDPRGVAILRGTVAFESDRQGIAEKAAKLQGVSDVINLLAVDPSLIPRPSTPAQPPPPPVPDPGGRGGPPPPEARPADPAPSILPEAQNGENASLRDKVLRALNRRPLLKDLPIGVTVSEGTVTLTGEVPTILEAMTAFRAAQQTIGVKSMEDRLRFQVPDGQRPNPLLVQGRPEDVEPYLFSQIQRQVNDQAHIDRVELRGDRLMVSGTVDSPEDGRRIEAVLRSMAVLRGFEIQTDLRAD